MCVYRLYRYVYYTKIYITLNWNIIDAFTYEQDFIIIIKDLIATRSGIVSAFISV